MKTYRIKVNIPSRDHIDRPWVFGFARDYDGLVAGFRVGFLRKLVWREWGFGVGDA